MTRTSDREPGDGVDRPVRFALGGLGLTFLGTAVALALVADGRSGDVVRLAAVPGFLGAFMLAVAIRG